jgi:hypothetical protein
MQPRFAAAARLLAVAGIALAAAASAKQQTAPPAQNPQGPPPVAMDPQAAVGLWRSNFGPVKIEFDTAGGAREDVQGAWSYMRGDQTVTGVFWGRLRGNVLDFKWNEPGVNGPLEGEGYIQFTPDGLRFDGQWWTLDQSRKGGFNATRHQGTGGVGGTPTAPPPIDTYGGGDPYGGAPPPPPPY